MSKKWFVLTGLAVLALVAGLAAYVDYRVFLDTPVKVPDQGMQFTIPPGASIAGIARRLEDRQVIRSSFYLQIYARLEGLAPRIQAGEYVIAPDTTPRALLEQWVAGRVIQYGLTIVEGWTFQQMLEAVANHQKIDQSLQGLNEGEIMARLGHPGQHPEGRFFPDTYHFPAGTSDLTFLRRAYQAMETHLNQAWENRAPDLPLQTPYEALILASIIEKETGLAGERRQIAGVFIRRLKIGMPLQTDPTVIYGMGDAYEGSIRKRDLQTDTPYNTYTRRGLPPTPIALPGADSLAAAVNPAAGTALYFVARGDGGHVFSDTLQEHNRAVRKYILNRQVREQ